uniref:Type-1 restriction enzyme MjaXIP specificity protein n=1 Tax=Candidatus Methanogaster sp. ANME-2c ERB4 TaxID=2759911 RepID=A0A7G9Y8J5_9EURY|nr:type-1 restriction enzyme MjaXIP specificity protein [Methanosarcinales archaeon ANME-2c ERB4]QNO46488.1 type-1 restriction enzyme MjaXIP specificity protein [Methanosarcinales archaeon ANME-2c ERB4]
MSVEGWQTKSLGAVIKDIGDGGTPNTNKKEYFGGTIPWIVIQDIRKEISSSKTTLAPIGLDSCSAKLWPTGSVILSTGATIGEVGIAKVPVSTKQGIHGIVCGEELLSSFLYYKLQTLRDFLNANAQGSTIREIRATFLRTIPISFPTALPEQTKIAEILSTVDRAIEQTEAIIAKQQRIKTGLMQDLLTRGIDEHGNLRSEETHEFKDSPLGRIPVEWEVATAGEVSKSLVPGRDKPELDGGGVPWITIPDIEEMYIEEAKTGLSLSKNAIKAANARLMPQGTVLMSCVGEFGIATIAAVDVAANQQLHGFICDQNVLPEWLVVQLTGAGQRIDRMATQTTIKYLNKTGCESILITVPDRHEQEHSIALLSRVLNLLTQQQKHLAKFQAIKTALMQDLLTGKKRVTALLNDTEVT